MTIANDTTQNQDSPFLADPRVQRAIQLVWHEAAILDRKDYPAWEQLYTGDGYYIVPVDPETEDFENSLNMIYDDARMRGLRVQRMIQGYAPSAVAAATTARTVSRFELVEPDDTQDADRSTVTLRSAQVLVAFKRNATQVIGADLTHTVTLGDAEDGSGDRIVRKVARLIDSQDAIKAAGYLI
jgi:3-phenylpropionate/cinnamic acid dioxygenase small subunit